VRSWRVRHVVYVPLCASSLPLAGCVSGWVSGGQVAQLSVRLTDRLSLSVCLRDSRETDRQADLHTRRDGHTVESHIHTRRQPWTHTWPERSRECVYE